MDQRIIELGGWRAIDFGSVDAELAVVVLHGREMEAADLAPFAHALGVAARFIFADGPLPGNGRGRAWWTIDSEARARALANGPLDLAATEPTGRTEARAL